MGILYTVWPIDSQAQEWLNSQDIPFPKEASRWPSRQELEKVLSELRGFEVQYTLNGPGQRWDAFITDGESDGNWTILHAEPHDGNDNCTEISFEKGEPTLIVAILQSLSVITGPYMLLPDIGCPPMVVSVSQSVADIVANYCTVEESSQKWQRLIGAQLAGPNN